MFHRKLIHARIQQSGVRIGDKCQVFPFQGRRRQLELNRSCIDIVSKNSATHDSLTGIIELPHLGVEPFHYRLELDEERFVLKTLKGPPFLLNGLAAREAFLERDDRLYIEDHKFEFLMERPGEQDIFEHPVLGQDKLMKSELKILIMGETGTGKTHLAKKIHSSSLRTGEFVALNLGSLNPQLIESEIFGHKKGAFTGATSDKVGALKIAHRGTLFLDEIDSLALDTQLKLLTFIDSKSFRPVGDFRESNVDVRMIFAAGRSLEKLVESGHLRKDFYYRLKSGHTIFLKALREDPVMIKKACTHFAKINQIELTDRLINFYQTLSWPGNLRQLFGQLEKKKVLSKSLRLDFDRSDEEFLLQDEFLNKDSAEITPMSSYKLAYVKRAVSICDGNVSLAARKLELSQKTVRGMLAQN